MINPLIELESHGVSIWLDYISTSLLESGELARMINNDHLKGVTSNPSIFNNAIADAHDYDAQIQAMAVQNLSDTEIYEHLAIKDIQAACDAFLPTYKKDGNDGFASLEVSPLLAHDSAGSIEEGQRFWRQVNRPNLMIKIPGTDEGMHAIRTLISLGINVNVTLLFSVDAYKKAATAYLLGLSDRREQGLPIDNVRSVASFFISRIDSRIDSELERIEKNQPQLATRAQALKGCIAIANAQHAYQEYLRIYACEPAKTLLMHGAQPQRLLWASTGTKNTAYSDVMYVESLIADNTVNTLPLATINAFRDHGRIPTLNNFANATLANKKITDLEELGIDLQRHLNDLLNEGISLFKDSLRKLLTAVHTKRK